jgi:hypothetical protein
MRLLRLAIFTFVVTVMAQAATVGFARAQSTPGVPVAEATDDQKTQAADAFKQGRSSFDDRRFVDALSAFRKSYGVVASPNTHLMIAHTLRELGRAAEAYDEFAAVAEEAQRAAKADPKYEEAVKLALEEQQLLREKVGLVTLEVVGADPDASLSVGGRKIPRENWGKPVAVDPGTATFLLTTTDKPVVRELEVTPGGDHRLRIDASAKTEPQPVPDGDERIQWLTPLRIASYAVAGAGIASFAVAGGLGGAALSKHNELEDACGDLPCPDRQDDIDQGRTLQTASNAMIVVGAVLVAGGVALWFLAPELEGDGNVDGEADVELGLRVNASSITLMGRF